jgi:predicted PurR-regulated permease PerM
MSSLNPKLKQPPAPRPKARFNWNSVFESPGILSRVVVVVFVLIVLYYLLNILHPFFAALTWAAILATALYSVFDRIKRWTHRPHLASALTCLLVTVLVVVPLIALLALLAGESVLAYHTLAADIVSAPLGELEVLRRSAVFVWVQSKLTSFGLPPIDLGDWVLRAVKLLSAFLVGKSTALFAEFTNFVFSFFVVFITLYVLFLHGPEIMDDVRWLCGLERGKNDHILTQFRDTILASLEGSVISALLLGALGWLVFVIFRIPAPLLWGAVMAVLSLVPVVGTALVWAPVSIYYMASGHAAKGIGLLVVFVTLIAIVDNVVKPLLMRTRDQIHPLWIFLGVVGGVRYFGLLGLVLGPLVVTAFLVLLSIKREADAQQRLVRE